MFSIGSLTSTLNSWGAVWSRLMLRNSVDAAVLLVALLVLWLPFRRWISNQFTIGMFALVLLKLALPVPLELSVPWATIWPSSHLSSSLAEGSMNPAVLVKNEVRLEQPQSDREASGHVPQKITLPPTEPSLRRVVSHPVLFDTPRRPIAPRPPPAKGNHRETSLSISAILMLAWLAIVSFLWARLIRNNLLLSRRLRVARFLEPATLPIDWSHLRKLAGIRRAVPLMESEHVSAPAVWGLLRPRVFVPEGLIERLAARPLAWVLLHELTHIRRHDLWLNLFQRIVQITYFFHPAAWIAGRMIDVHCEYACDDAALSACRETPRQECGHGLLAVVEQAQEREAKPAIKLGLGMYGSKHLLRQRVDRILDTRRVLCSRLSLGAAVILVGVAILTLPYVRAQIRTPTQPASQNQPAVGAGSQPQAPTKAALSLAKATESQSAATSPASRQGADGTPRSIEVLVINAKTQQPEPGVTVRYGSGNPQKQGVTDKDGRFIIKEDGREFTGLGLTFRKSGFVALRVVWSSGLSRSPVEIPRQYTINLEPGSTIGGIVKDEQGRPISGATVWVSVPEGRLKNGVPQVEQEERKINTDETGLWRYDLAPARPNTVMIRVAHPDFAENNDPMGLRLQESREIRELQNLSHVLVLKKGLPIAGKVLDPSGRPIDQAEVALYLPRGKAAKTDNQGSFKLPHLMPGKNRLTVKAKGYVPTMQQVVVTEKMRPLELRLEPGRTVSGQILDESKQPVSGARLSIDAGSSNSGLWTPATSDKDGRFRIDGIPAFETKLRGYRQGMPPFTSRIPSTVTEITLVTKPDVLHIRGTVTDAANGQPIPSFDVVLNNPFRGRYESAAGRFERTFDREQITFSAIQISVEAPGYASSRLRDVPTDKDEITLDFQLTKSPRITGIVREPDGTPIMGAQVGLGSPSQLFFVDVGNSRLDDSGHYTIAETDASGHFSFPARSDPFSIVAVHPRGCAIRTAEQLSAWAKSPIQIALQSWARVEGVSKTGGRLRGNDEISISNVDFVQTSNPKAQYRDIATTDSQRRFVFPKVLPGIVAIHQKVPLRAGEWMIGRPIAPLELKPGETRQVIVGGTGRPVIGRVTIPEVLRTKWELTDRSGTISIEPQTTRPYDQLSEDEQARYDWERQKSYRSFRFVIRTDGSFRADEVPPGTYQLFVQVSEDYVETNFRGYIPLGSIRKTITVPPIPGGLEYTDEPLDLGSFPIELTKRVEVGDVAPDFQANALDGKPLTLKQFRGKYTLLVLCRSSFEEIRDDWQYLKGLFDSHAKDDRFKMVGVKIYPGSRRSKEEQGRASGGWLLAELSAPKAWAFHEAYGTYTLTSIWLIAPDGKVIARDLRRADIKETVERSLRSR